MNTTATVTPDQVAEHGRQGPVDLIDVRTPLEFQTVRAASARNIPLDVLEPQAVMQGRDSTADAPLYIICKSGARGAKAQQAFFDAGFPNVINIEGGTDAWVLEGLPVVRGRKSISLERQVRITAGFIVLVGALLGIFVDPYYAGISAFVGAGLMFAGITDSCAMGLLIARMPWNKVEAEEPCCTVK